MEKLTAIFRVKVRLPSENQIRYRHWSQARKLNESLKTGWWFALRSSPSETEKLMMITSHLARKPFETLSPLHSALMTGAIELGGSMDLSAPMGLKKLSSE